MAQSVHLENVDFIKGVAAISVILLHTLPLIIVKGTFAVFHIWQAVPIFIFISYYLGFRNLDNNEEVIRCYYSLVRIKKTLLKILLPLLLLAVLEAVYFLSIGKIDKALGCVLCYGNGPGSYYVWCYMQIWLLMPVIYLLLKKFDISVGACILLIISILLDFLWEKYVSIKPGYTCFRYLFLAVPAFMYLKGISLRKIYPLISLSVIYLWLMIYSNVPILADPLLPNGWEAQTSMGFFYTLFLFVILSKLYSRIKVAKIKQYINHLGTISWEIFLVQMVLIGSGVLDVVSSTLFNTSFLRVGFKIIAALALTLILAEFYKKLLSLMFALRINRKRLPL